MSLTSEQIVKRPLYIDDNFEDMVFRVDEDNNVFFKTYGGDEIPTSWESRVFIEALHSGEEITKEQYDAK